MLAEHGIQIAPSTYYEARNRPPSKRALRDAEIVELIRTARQQRFQQFPLPVGQVMPRRSVYRGHEASCGFRVA